MDILILNVFSKFSKTKYLTIERPIKVNKTKNIKKYNSTISIRCVKQLFYTLCHRACTS